MIKQSKGFTLVEIIFSIAFLSIVSVVILQLFLTSNRLSDQAQTKNFANLYAANAIEMYKAEATSTDPQKQVQHYTDKWQLTSDQSQARYLLTLSANQDEKLAGLMHLNVVVVNLESQKLASLETSHYVKEGN